MVSIAEKESQKGGDAQWLRTVLTSGTLSDRLAALALQIQVHLIWLEKVLYYP